MTAVKPSPIELVTNQVHEQFESAVEIIDHHFGIDYSKKNPHLVAAVLHAVVEACKPVPLKE